jgi:predicted nucleotide-binding protein
MMARQYVVVIMCEENQTRWFKDYEGIMTMAYWKKDATRFPNATIATRWAVKASEAFELETFIQEI